MALASGTRLGVYDITAQIGEGGMGQVYRATDTRLKRQVAIKILPPSLAADHDRLARFQREAEVLASLNHPHIAGIYGLEESDGVFALVMELVEGEDLLQRIGRGAIPLDEALPIAKQIAEALEAAHEQGIIHRDLKPANIKVRSDGTVKVLDFGLAKAMAPVSPASGDPPTMTSPAMTEAGVILGTAAYMAPEQARGKAVDRRADIWAFGAVVYEMLSGRQLFKGETVSDMVAAVLRDEIDWTAVPAATPQPVRRLIERCLDRDIKRRLQAIGEARVTLEEATARASADSVARRPAAAHPTIMARGRWLAAAVVVIAFAGALVLWQRGRTAPDARGTTPKAGRSIAVLPFVNNGGSADDAYFADGMTDELIASLGKVPNLHVAARSSAFSFKGQKIEIRDVAKKLGVDSVLEGTVRRSGRRVRITASLVSAADGLQIWSSTFENDGGDPFAVQDEVTRGVVSGLSLQLAGTALQASQAGRTKDPEAHDLYLRGLASANAASEADLRRALEFYQQSIARDPAFALAYTGIAWVHVFLADAYVPPSEAYPKARAAAQAALERDGRLADAHALVAYSTAGEWGDRATIEREFSRALELDPNGVNTLLLRGVDRCFIDRHDEGLVDLGRAAQLDPLSPTVPMMQELCNYVDRRYGSVIEVHRKTQAIDPSFVYFQSWAGAAHRELGDYQAALREYAVSAKALNDAPQYGLAFTYLRMGRDRDAREILRRMDDRARTQYVPFITRAALHAAVGDVDVSVALLQQALERRESFMFALRQLPEMAPLLRDPRAQRIVERADAMRKGQ